MLLTRQTANGNTFLLLLHHSPAFIQSSECKTEDERQLFSQAICKGDGFCVKVKMARNGGYAAVIE